ncbi:MAG TPA: zf-HC2 domain-containing protein [Blastocatellia bacterium]|nr:zf-HC2 domain-containing protein [Blastocatellia bacterium]
MDCRIVRNSLSNYLDGLLPGHEVKLIENHLGECPGCQVVKLDLSEIRIAARELPLHTPPRALWVRIQQSIEAELAADGVGGRQAGKSQSGLARWWADLKSRQFTFSLPQLAGAGVLSVLLVGAIFFGAYRQDGVTTGPALTQASTALIPEEPRMLERIRFLTGTLDQRKASWDPTIQKLYEGKLTRINQKLEECKQKLREQPGNKEHEQMVRDLYNEEIEHLELFDKIR